MNELKHPQPTPVRILVLAEGLTATQHLSFEQPLRPMADSGQISLAICADNKAWSSAKEMRQFWSEQRPSVLVLSRFSNERALAFLALARAEGVPSVFHLDDDLLDVPMSVGAAKFEWYHQPERLESLRSALDSADLVYASTRPLADRLIAHGVKTPVVAGDLYCSVDVDNLGDPLPATGPVIGYMGTAGHAQDLSMVMPVIISLLQSMPELRFETYGFFDPPPELGAFGGRYAHHPGEVDYGRFMRHLADLGWWIGIAPLEDNPFNRCKADTKWVEYSNAGIAVVASGLPVYAQACADGGGLLADTPDEWSEALRRSLQSKALRDALVDRARTRLVRQYSRTTLATQILRVLERAGEAHRLRHRSASTTAAPVRAPTPPIRILFVANALIPTLQLSFLKPLAPDVAAGNVATDLITGEEIRAKHVELKERAKAGAPESIQTWLSSRIDDFKPTHVIFCRYSDRFAERIVELARRRGLPILLHIDDDLLNVPVEIGEAKYRFHNAPDRLAAVRFLLDQSDFVYCSTQALLERFRAQGVATRMAAGKVYCASRVFNRAARRPVRKLGYMGFDHAHDFELVLPALVQTLRSRPHLVFELFGSIPKPAALEEFGSRVTVIPPVRVYTEFMERFASLQWDIGLCPLADTNFNRVKANTKWVEYTAVGAAVIATRGMAYDDCCGDGCGELITASGDWLVALLSLCDDPDRRFEMVARAQSRLEQEYSDERLRLQIHDVLAHTARTAA